MRIMVCQMGGCAGKEVREIKMSTTEKLIQKYNINLVACMELNFNWSKVSSSANLASWLDQEERETKIHHSTQHTGTGLTLFKTPTRRYEHGMPEQICPIRTEGIS